MTHSIIEPESEGPPHGNAEKASAATTPPPLPPPPPQSHPPPSHRPCSRDTREPFMLKFRSSKSFIVSVVTMAIFTDNFLYGLILPVFPFSLEDRANVAHEDVQKWVSVLTATFGAGLLVGSPLFGYLADRASGRRAPFLAGLVTLALATIMLCVGSNLAILIVGRLLQGLSAAVVWTVGLAFLADSVGKDEVGECMGVVAVGFSFGIFLGPLLGGVVYERGGYYAVFAMGFALIGIDIILRLLVVEKAAASRYTRSGETISDAPPTRERAEADAPCGISPGEISAPPAAGRKGASHRASRSCRWSKALPPTVTLLRYPRLLTALWASLMQAVLMTGFETTLPIYVRDTFGFHSTGAGLMFLPIVLPTFFAPLIGKMSDRYGPRFLIAGGCVLLVPFLILLRLPDRDSVSAVVLFCVLLTFVGVGMALVVAPVMAEISLVVSDLEEQKPGRFGPNGALAQAYGLFNIAFAGGSLGGPLLAGFVNTTVGWKVVTLVLGILCALTAVPSFIYTGGLVRKRDLRFSLGPAGLHHAA